MAGMSGRGSAPIPEARQGTSKVGFDEREDDLAWMREASSTEQLWSYLRSEREFYDRASHSYAPVRNALREAALARQPEAARSPSWTVAGDEHFWQWQPGDEFPSLVRRSGGADMVETPLLECEGLTRTGFVRLGECLLSPDGRWLAYSVDTIGNEEYELRVRDTRTGVDLPSTISRTYYGLLWLPDSSGLLYVRHDAAYRPSQVWLHRPTVECADRLVHEELDERFHVMLRGSGDGRHAIIRSAARLTAEERLMDLTDPTGATIGTFGRTVGLDYTVEPVTDQGEVTLFVILNDVAVEYRLVRGVIGNQLHTFEEVLGGDPRRRLREIVCRDGHLVVQGRQDGQASMWVLPASAGGAPYQLGPDEPGGALRLEPYDADGTGTVCVATESRRTPTVWSSLDLATGQQRELRRQPAGSHVPDDYVVEEHSVVVRDGTVVPVTVIRAAGVTLDGRAPCLLYGYGAWEHVIDPTFDPALLALLDTGVVFAHAHVRGGGELGRGWWLAGRMEQKQHTFSDFLDVADHLADGVVDGRRIVAKGLSAGGLLVGAAYSQRPDRWLGVIAEAPFVDPVTTMSDEAAPLVITERDEWGDPRQDRDREWMLAWSPYDNPPAGQRPALLVTSAVNDPRVSVWEPARWVGRLRRTGSTDGDVLFRCELGARGHWPPPGRHAKLEFEVNLLAWAAHLMNG